MLTLSLTVYIKGNGKINGCKGLLHFGAYKSKMECQDNLGYQTEGISLTTARIKRKQSAEYGKKKKKKECSCFNYCLGLCIICLKRKRKDETTMLFTVFAACPGYHSDTIKDGGES